MTDAVIVAAARSPIGRAFKGALKDVRSDDLGAAMMRAALDQVPEFDPKNIDDVLWGCAQPAGEQGYGLGRVVATHLGLDQVPGTTVNRYCGSSVQTTRMALHAIKAGEAKALVSGGSEVISRYNFGKSDNLPDTYNPTYEAARERTAKRAEGGAPVWTDPRENGELPDIYIAMGQTAENVAQLRGVSREAQDEWGLMSQTRAQEAIANGFFDTDITPFTLPDGTVMNKDESPRATSAERLAGLDPVFRPDGTVTAGNCCPLNDGAAALVVMSSDYAAELGIKPLAKILSTGVSALSAEVMGLGPVEATKNALALAGMSAGDLDLIEINEAFAAQVIPSVDDLGLDVDRVNVHGGAIALGHPYGQTGARLTTTLINGLKWHDKSTGLVTMCTAGGQGMALIIERMN
ncbi:acetyl-CoA C-acetyltransferase [Enemella sp. A6]|uniref:acetyl-CoA C-acetyltransferase n=1 Tax=Enemella sp. A6 TaxID=3440152 RepID=UPI003EBC7A5F